MPSQLPSPIVHGAPTEEAPRTFCDLPISHRHVVKVLPGREFRRWARETGELVCSSCLAYAHPA